MNNNIKICTVTSKDFLEYLNLAKKFHEHSPIKEFADFDVESCLLFLKNATENENIIFLACKDNDKIVGITGGLLFPLYFNHNYKVVQEICWWVEPEYRGSKCGSLMYEALENWAKEKQANGMFMIALEDENVETMSKLYTRKGFVGTERTFIKEL